MIPLSVLSISKENGINKKDASQIMSTLWLKGILVNAIAI
jgi:hypothetical protein